MMDAKKYITIIALITSVITIKAQDYFDDIYYNPKKDIEATTTVKSSPKKQSNYIANFEDIDVDTYNRRGEQYYLSRIDTIGSTVENGEDFVYTQQIQKYYNPTIVVDNANALGDVLSNAYGNVDIIINDNGYPVFGPWYGYSWPYYSSLWSPWSWGFNFGGWGWSIGWYDPWFSWNWGWGPSWAWGPAWGPGWGGPGWGPGPGPGWGPGPMATWSPRGNRSIGPRPGWNAPNRPGENRNMAMNPQGGNFRGNTAGYGGIRNNNGMHASSRPAGVVNNGGRWEYNTTAQTGHRTAGTGVISNAGSSNNKNSQTISRPVNSRNNNGTVTNNRNNNNTNRSTMSTGRNNSRSTGGSFGGGGRSTGGRGGGGGGRHR